jgi:hypothetical protein
VSATDWATVAGLATALGTLVLARAQMTALSGNSQPGR